MTDIERLTARVRDAVYILRGAIGDTEAESAAVREVRAWREAVDAEESILPCLLYERDITGRTLQRIRARVTAALATLATPAPQGAHGEPK